MQPGVILGQHLAPHLVRDGGQPEPLDRFLREPEVPGEVLEVGARVRHHAAGTPHDAVQGPRPAAGDQRGEGELEGAGPVGEHGRRRLQVDPYIRKPGQLPGGLFQEGHAAVDDLEVQSRERHAGPVDVVDLVVLHLHRAERQGLVHGDSLDPECLRPRE